MATMDAQARAWLYARLADLFSGTLPDVRGRPEGAAGWPSPISAALDSLSAAVTDGDTFASEYVRLFVTARDGVAAPPYASWYLDGRLMGPSSDWAARAYAAQGLSADDEAGEPPDYLASELEFVYFLARHEIAARTTGDDRALATVLEAETDFARHIAAWVPRFVQAVHAADPHPVFAAAARLLSAVIAEHARLLSNP